MYSSTYQLLSTLLFTNIQFIYKEHVQKTFFVWKLFPTFGVLEKVWGSLQKFTTKTKNCLPLLFTISTKDKHSQPLKWFLLMPCWAFTLAKIFCESWYESNNKDNMYTLFYYWERERERERERWVRTMLLKTILVIAKWLYKSFI